MKTQIQQEFEKPIYTREELCAKLKTIFKKHIGRENPITKQTLYTRVFGSPENYDAYELWYNWMKMRTAMNWLRRTTKYFIVSKPSEQYQTIWEYFIVVDDTDADTYRNLLTGTRKKINYMLRRVDKAIQENFAEDVKNGLAD